MDKIFFLDFDGTITKNDVVATMVMKFSRNNGWQDLNERWQRGELSTEECANQTFALFDATMEDIYRLLDIIELDDFFKDFVDICNARSYPVYVLSDGYDVLINYIFQRHGLNILNIFANRMINSPKGFLIDCTYKNTACGKCGTCKTQLLNSFRKGAYETVYVGDSYSDMCVCHQADIVFAKDALLDYCRRKNLNHKPYDSFLDIINWLKD